MNRSIVLAVFSGLFAAGLAGAWYVADEPAADADKRVAAKRKTLTIVCQFAVRPSTRVARFDKKDIVVEVPVTDGPVAEIGRVIPPKTAEFDDFRVQVSYNTNSLIVRIYDKKARRVISSNLFQFGPKLHNQFHGGHGFTGLTYVYHPKGDAELQYWCKVK